jgi:hypothetical protein
MINDRLLTVPFAWYKQEAYQERFSKGCLRDDPKSLIAPNDRLLPFQIRIPKTSGSTPLVITELILSIDCSSAVMDLSYNIPDLLIISTDPLCHQIIYKGDTQMEMEITPGGATEPLEIPRAVYAAKLTTNHGTFWSELFCAKSPDELGAYYKMSWWANTGFADVIYSTGYKNIAYLDAVMLPPKVEIEEENEKDGFGNPVPVRQRFIHRYRMAMPEILHSQAIAITTIPLHPHNLLELPDGRSTSMDYMRSEPEFMDCGCLVAMEFQETVIIKTACND